MDSVKTTQSDNQPEEPVREEAADSTGNGASTPHSNIFAQQFTADDGGVPTDMYCPGCREEIHGSYLPIFFCPFLKSRFGATTVGL